MQIDDRIKQAQRRGAGIYLLGAVFTFFVFAAVLSWLFLVKAYVLNIGPTEALPSATIKVDSGSAYVANHKVYTLGGTVNISVSAQTFETTSLAISNDSPSNIEVILQPSPAQIIGSIEVEGAALSGETSWYIENSLVQVGNNLNYSVAAGEYELSVNNPYYKPYTTTINAQRGERLEVAVKLEPVQGAISINTQPSGAEIFINNEMKGTSPLVVELSGGKYSLTSLLQGYQSIEDEIEVSSTAIRPERNYRLLPVQSQLNISASPNDGVLLINKLEQPLGLHSLDANTSHSIEYRKPGYFPFKRSIKLAPQEQQSMSIALEPEIGRVWIASNVEADLSIDSKAQGKVGPDGRAFELMAKPLTIVLSKKGYRSVTQSVTASSARELKVEVKLLTEFDARRKEGRPLAANQLGIKLLKFNPDPFVMGSPPNETGRRRNEHQVKVDFTRSFWVSETEITQAQFAAFTGQASNSKLPQVEVTWDQAALFCNWLSVQEGLPPFYKVSGAKVTGFDTASTGYRLPTEAEWEWLAKKAKRSRSTVYVWGDQTRIPTNIGNFADESAKGNQLILLEQYNDGQAGLAPVASFKADRIGLFDLAGNASEWVHDFYTTALPDTQNVQTDYMGAPRGTQHVVKGGNYTSGRLRELRAAFREVGESAKPTIGFRIARYDN
ncbi:SUMF1/EgtB/PvdO family nonheme iron enzyme [Glaciecola siphonariae]|uniref:SUMF1/EgtB/PvdO family nonheme iron enzyme n=1 Tax=Glaciecola siphonariae TaxID=521012 RepID=A0ABV9LX62_9ALTE